MMQKEEMELYIHIPFCVKKCNYCDFLSFSSDEATMEEYVHALIKQINLESQRCNYGEYGSCSLSSIYFGGGTPSLFSIDQLEKIMQAVLNSFDVRKDAEITIEVNPKTAGLNKLKAIKQMGFNRISIGMQSSYDDELEMLGRIHTYDDFKQCYVNSRLADFSNINVDIMTALPGQSPEKLMGTLERVIGLYPEHISTYSLIIEENTPFYEKYKDIEGPVVGEGMERRLYWDTVGKLKANGYGHYEISNFAKAGFEGRHNLGYWTRKPYIGLGLGASSMVYKFKDPYGLEQACIRSKNTSSLGEYLKNPDLKEEESSLSLNDEIEEFMFLGLRMMEGVSTELFKVRFNYDYWSIYGPVTDRLMREGILLCENNRVRLSERGIDYGNYAFSSFLLA